MSNLLFVSMFPQIENARTMPGAFLSERLRFALRARRETVRERLGEGELRNRLRRDGDRFARRRVAALTLGTTLDFDAAEVLDVDRLSGEECLGHRLESRLDDLLRRGFRNERQARHDIVA